METRGAIEISSEEYEERPHYRIVTGYATWYYDKAGGGFSRLLDRDGRDWISFRKDPLSTFPDSAAAGYRGLGNMLFGANNPDAGAGHPGFDLCESKIISPNAIRTVSLSGRWAWTWTFSDRSARFHMEKASPDHTWWFLYEGPIAGRWEPNSHYWGTDLGGPNRDTPDIRNQEFGHWRWAYFGDAISPRVLFVGQTQADDLPDTLWYLGASDGGAIDSPDGMVVFGLGRGPGTTSHFQGAGQEIIVGFVEATARNPTDHDALAGIIENEIAEKSAPVDIENAVR